MKEKEKVDDDPYDGMARVVIPTEDEIRDFKYSLNWALDGELELVDIKRLIRLAFDYAAHECYLDEQADFLRRLIMYLEDRHIGKDCQDRLVSAWITLSAAITKVFTEFQFDMVVPPKFIRLTASMDIVCLEKE